MKTTKYFLLPAVAILLASCFKRDDYKDIKSEDVLEMQTESESIKADGASSAEIIVKVSDKAIDASKRNVLFVTSLGNFSNGKDSMYAVADEKFIAKTSVSSVRKGTANVVAYLQGISSADTAKIEFTAVGPDKIMVSVDSFSIENNFRKETLITASLSTNDNGKPTIRHRVDFEVMQNNMPVGVFLNGVKYGFSDADGKVKLRYAADATVPAGIATIIAKTKSQTGDTIYASTIIYIKQ